MNAVRAPTPPFTTPENPSAGPAQGPESAPADRISGVMNTRPDTHAAGAAAAPITVRLFAAAKAAVGAPEVALPASGTIAEALAVVGAAAIDPPSAERVFARCTFLVDGVAVPDPATPLRPGATLDVLPPFAGG